MNRVVIAVVYAVEVFDEETNPQMDTFERFHNELPECPHAQVLFSSGVLTVEPRDVETPDFDMIVSSHARMLEPVPYQ